MGKQNKCFINFDIVEYYPSIKKKHLFEALKFAKDYIEIDDHEKDIILNACKTIMMHDNRIWQKKNNDELFDVPMGSFHGAEICDLVGLVILERLSQSLPSQSYGLYRDDGLAFTDIAPPSELERLKKKIISTFKNIGFKITIDVGAIRTNFLDITLDLNSDIYQPYRKPNSEILYINAKSNHPAHIKKSIPSMITKRLCSLSKTKEEFDKCKPDYENALMRSGFKEPLKFEGTCNNERKKKRQRRRKCLFYNPPYCQSVRNNIGTAFLRLVNKHFTKTHPYRQIFNRCTLKISYSCMANIKSIIQSHNKKILTETRQSTENEKKCNCQKQRKDMCPLAGECIIENVIYEAEVKSDTTIKRYVGSTGGGFKKRWYKHKSDFNNKKNKLATELSKHIWKLKDKNKKYEIKWKILRKIKQTDKTIKKVCTTCTLEKLEISIANKNELLNRRSELLGKCVHHQNLYL